jgi:cytochrome c-type biogenesis protein CcmF
LVWRAPRRYGGYIIHFGVLLIFVGFAGAAFTSEYEKTLAPGERFHAGGYDLTFRGLDESADASMESVKADVLVARGGRDLAVLKPHRNWYRKSEQLSTEVAILSTWRHDLYLILAGLDPESDKASFKVYLNPLVGWFWWGGIVMCLGGVLVLLPRPKKAAA